MQRNTTSYAIRLKSNTSVTNKMFDSAFLLPILLFIAVVSAVAVAYLGVSAFVMILTVVLALPIAYVIVAYPKAGILIFLSLAYVIMFFARLGTSFPVGTVMDAVEGLLVFGFLLKQKTNRDLSYFKNGVSGIIIIWVGYNFLQILNPSAASRLAWLYTVRAIAIVAVSYFIFTYHIRDVKFIRTILKLWICLSTVAALYALKQEFFGFADFEKSWLSSDPSYSSLYYVGNHWRKFSIFTDPMTFSYNMAISSILCFALMFGPMVRRKKVILGILGCLFFVSMLYSGTRSAYVLLPVAFVLFGILKYNRKVLLFGIVIVVFAAGLILMPTSNYTLYRFQTAFKPSTDASFNLRKANQDKIKPFIQSHPLGGGLGSTGIWGKRFSPNSYLANFPPDSGYVRIAVELGWVGLLLFCTFMFLILKTGIVNYFKIRDPELKSYCFSMLLILFALNIGNYPQEAIVQYPINVFFYLAVALIVVCARLDKEKSKEAKVISPFVKRGITV